MKESDLYIPIKRWLESFGYDVFAEVPYDSGNCLIDVFATHPSRYYAVTVELKTGFTRKLAYQARHDLITPFCYAAAPTTPRTSFMELARKLGIGVLRVLWGDAVVVLLKPRIEWGAVWAPYRRSVHQGIVDYGYLHAGLLGGVSGSELGKQCDASQARR